jgi:hypothetical protein
MDEEFDDSDDGAFAPSSSESEDDVVDDEEAISDAAAETTSPVRGEGPESDDEEEADLNAMALESAAPPRVGECSPSTISAAAADALPGKAGEEPPIEVFTFDATFRLGPNGGGDDVSAVQNRYESEVVTAPSGDRWNVILLSHAFPPEKHPVARNWSAYLNIDGALLKPRNWYRRVRYAIEFVHHAPATEAQKAERIRKGTDTFTRERLDWGFKYIVTVARDGLVDGGAQRTVIDPALVDDATGLLTVRIEISVLDKWDNTQPLGRRAFERNCMSGIREEECREMTGYVGLENQGATCYMNSLLQSFFHTRRLVEAVYQMPTSALGHASEEARQSVPLALQRVFSMLETKTSAVSTTGLTQSFGWESAESFTQHDVQELLRLLCESLEKKMVGTCVDGTIGKLFRGRHQSYIKCTSVAYESKRDEEFYDIQLDVQGCADVHASFAEYVKVETLDGENQYDAGEVHGKQDAEKGVRFLAFPPVLHLHLKRFVFDPQSFEMAKVNDAYRFPLVLDVDDYLAEDAEASERNNVYDLHSVLVHRSVLFSFSFLSNRFASCSSFRLLAQHSCLLIYSFLCSSARLRAQRRRLRRALQRLRATARRRRIRGGRRRGGRSAERSEVVLLRRRGLRGGLGSSRGGRQLRRPAAQAAGSARRQHGRRPRWLPPSPALELEERVHASVRPATRLWVVDGAHDRCP